MKLSEIYHLYGKMVYNLALNYSQNSQDAEEITQDVFMVVHAKLQKFRADSELKTWIYRIAINKSIDYLRAKKSKKQWSFFSASRVVEKEISIADSEFNHPGVQLEQKEEIQKLFALINQLPENQKTVILLLRLEDLPMNEVCEIMGISYKAVESVLQRAKKNLKKLIEQAKENNN